eukprot:m.89510 g.89510  ORF g.89510 m.89510 type:complete len:107 (-) comp51041_c0_seq2:68-388(-)
MGFMDSSHHARLFFGEQFWQSLPKTHSCCVCIGLGGICSGQVMKHAGGVMRGFAIIAGLILTGLLQSYLESTPLSAETVVALPMVIAGTYLYLAYPYVDPKAAKKD